MGIDGACDLAVCATKRRMNVRLGDFCWEQANCALCCQRTHDRRVGCEDIVLALSSSMTNLLFISDVQEHGDRHDDFWSNIVEGRTQFDLSITDFRIVMAPLSMAS